VARQPARRHGIPIGAGQAQSLRQQASLGIPIAMPRLTHQRTGDQRTIVVTGTAQLQQHLHSRPLTPVIRQHPPTTGVEQIPFMDQIAIHPETHLVGPPAQFQTLTAIWARTPVLRPGDPLLDLQPDTTAGPDQQPPLSPVRTVPFAPWLPQHRPLLPIAMAMPEREQIHPAATSKRFNPRQSSGLQRGLHRDLPTLTHKMMAL